MTKCQTCNKDYTPECDYNQGRCPNHPPLIEISLWRKSVYMFFAPLFILGWCIMNPKKVWEQAKKDWKL